MLAPYVHLVYDRRVSRSGNSSFDLSVVPDIRGHSNIIITVRRDDSQR